MEEIEWQDGKLDLASIAAARQLEYLSVRSDIRLLTLLDLPVMVGLAVPPSQQTRFALIRQMTDTHCRIRLERDYVVPLEAITQRWFREAHVFWKNYEEIRTTLAMGSSGPAVEKLQTLLANVPTPSQSGTLRVRQAGEPTPFFGPQTQDAVAHFQKVQRLVPDGIVGPQTLILLYRRLPEYTPPSLSRRERAEGAFAVQLPTGVRQGTDLPPRSERGRAHRATGAYGEGRMSTILDALRKIEGERQEQSGKVQTRILLGPPRPLSAPPPHRSRLWRAGMSFLLVGFIVGVWMTRQEDIPPEEGGAPLQRLSKEAERRFPLPALPENFGDPEKTASAATEGQVQEERRRTGDITGLLLSEHPLVLSEPPPLQDSPFVPPPQVALRTSLVDATPQGFSEPPERKLTKHPKGGKPASHPFLRPQAGGLRLLWRGDTKSREAERRMGRWSALNKNGRLRQGSRQTE